MPIKRGYVVKRLGRLDTISFEGMTVAPVVTKQETQTLVAYHIRVPRHHRIPPSYHKIAHEVIFIIGGRGTAHLNRRRVPVRKGNAIVVRPRTWHSFSTAGEPLELLAVTAPRVDAVTDIYYE